MIEFFKNWCEGIIVAVIISIIIEAILPEGNNKKYVKVVIGVYIIFTILNPFLGKLDSNIELSNTFDLPSVETSSVDTSNIRELYANGIEETLKNAIQEEFGYTVPSIQIKYDETYENIEQINLQIQEAKVSQIEKVQIGNQATSQETQKDYPEVKDYIAENYEIEKNKILIN